MNENIVDRGRTNVIGNEGLDTAQNPINIFEWNDPDKSSSPTIRTKSPYNFESKNISATGDISADGVFNNYRPPIGIPTFWFTSVLPDWALDCTDGAGYDFATYPELDNEHFKQFLADFTDFDSADDTTTFDMPDLKGMFGRLAGTNGIYGAGIHVGGAVGGYTAHQFEIHAHNHRHSMGVSTDDNYHGSAYPRTSNDNSSTNYTNYTAANPSSGNYGSETRPASFSNTILVRFE